MQIILFHPNTGHDKFYRFYWLPYSILTVASGCVEDGFDVFLIDANATNYDEIIGDLRNNLDQTICIGISCMTGHQISNGLIFANAIRAINPRIPIIWGGAHPTLFPQQCLEHPLVDFVVQGQGEIIFRKLVQSLSDNLERPSNISGVGVKINETYHFGSIPPMHDKNLFPDIPWKLLNLDIYVRNDPGINTRTLNYVSSQGCPFACGFCSEVALYNQKWTAFSAERIINDISTLKRLVQINGVKFYDANFFVDPQRSLLFAERVKDYDILWAASSHPGTLMKLEDGDLKLLKESGCTRLLIGAESGSQNIMDLIQKKFKVIDLIPLAIRLRNAGIVGSFTFIVGFPKSPDPDEFSKTLEMGRKIRRVWHNHEVKVHFYAPYPGTPLWQRAIDAGFRPPHKLEEWAEYDYYQIETPWMNKQLESSVQIFNKENCPYVQL